MIMDFKLLANRSISQLTPYQPGKPIAELERELGIHSAIKLASNENPLGASQLAVEAGQQAMLDAHIYPDGGCFELKKTLADFLKIQAAQLTMGNGSENILELIVKSYLSCESSAVISQYAFLTIPLLIQSYGARIIQVPADNYRHDINAMIAAVDEKTRIIFIVNPNNPTGTYITQKEMLLLLKSIPAHILVVVDEAYYEYIQENDYPDMLALMATYPNLIVTRTFSKAYGLAGLRLGYAASSVEIADILNRARLPFNVNTPAACAAQAAILDQGHIKKSVELNVQGMVQLKAGLNALNLEYIPSLGNFIAVDVKQNALEIYQKLLHHGVIVRHLNAYGMTTHLRVTIGTLEQNKRFLTALSEVI